MDSIEKKWLLGRLAGYVDVIASIDGVYGDSLAAAYIASLDESDLLESLKEHLQQETKDQYLYDSISEIPKPWTRQLHNALESFFLHRPFGMSDDLGSEQLKKTRYNLVWKVMEMVRLITNDFSCEKISCVEMRSNNGYVGHMYVLPLDQDFLLLKTISRLGVSQSKVSGP